MRNWLKAGKALRVVGYVLIAYVAASLLAFVFQDQLIFQGDPLPGNHTFNFESRFEEYFIDVQGDETLHAILFRTANTPKGLVLYFHGNADNLDRWGKYAGDFTGLGYDVLMFDYRGYGKSTGQPSESLLYQDAHLVYRWAMENFKYDRLILYGRSLGSTVASSVAAKEKVDMLILETPFDEMRSVIYWPFKPLTRWLPLHNNFSNTRYLPSVTCPVYIFHGTADWIVPLASAKNLLPYLKSPGNFFLIEGGGHNDLREFQEYHNKLKELL